MLALGIFQISFWASMMARRRVAILLGGVLVFLFSALRFNAGIDYLPYYRMVLTGEFDRVEPLSWLLMQAGYLTHPQVYFALSSAVSVGFMVAAINKVMGEQPVSRLALICFVCLPIGLIDSMSFVRQFCSASVLCYAIVSKDRPIQAVFLAMLSPLFHMSSMIFVPLVVVLVFWSPALPAFAYLLLLGLGLVLSPFAIAAFKGVGFYASYFETATSTFGRGILILMSTVTAYLLFRRKYLVGRSAELTLYFAGFCVYAILSPYGTLLSRAGWAGMAPYPILLGVALARETKAMRTVVAVGMLSVFCILVYLAQRNADWNWLSEYQPFMIVGEEEAERVLSKYSRTVR